MPCDSCRPAYLSAVCCAQLHAPRCVCEACERAVAAVACRAGDAALCADRDVQVHSANALGCGQLRFPVFPLSAEAAEASCEEEPEPEAAAAESWPLLNKNYYSGDAGDAGLLPCGEFDEYLDLTEYDYDPFRKQTQEDRRRPVSDSESEACECVVPSQPQPQPQPQLQQQREAWNCTAGSSRTASYSRSVSYSSMEAIAVPDTTTADTSNSYLLHSKGTIDLFSGPSLQLPLHFNSVDRKARLRRYQEKRKTRKFEKTIRYASRKAYAESRPRIKGRFVKRSDLELKVDQIDIFYYCDILC